MYKDGDQIANVSRANRLVCHQHKVLAGGVFVVSSASISCNITRVSLKGGSYTAVCPKRKIEVS